MTASTVVAPTTMAISFLEFQTVDRSWIQSMGRSPVSRGSSVSLGGVAGFSSIESSRMLLLWNVGKME